MKKLAIVLVDGMDPDVINQYIKQLPNISSLIGNGCFKRMDSVFPPDSIPAWTTIYTGLNPGEHGIFESFDYLQLKNRSVDYDTDIIRGNTFWDKISAKGYKVGIFNPFLAYPSWDVNGFMLCGPVFQTGEVSSNKEELIKNNNVPPLGAIVDYPTKDTLKSFYCDTFELTKQQNKLALKLFAEEKCDMFFYGSLTTDRLKHYFWKFTDKTDPKYPGKNQYENAVLDIYKEVDSLIGDMRKIGGDEYRYILLSDHGHQRRVIKTFNLNEWLRRNCYIDAKYNIKSFIEVTKNITLEVLDKLNITELALKHAKKIPGAKSLKSSDYVLKKDRKIYVPRYAGMNPYGGIAINKEKYSDEEYRNLVNDLKSKLAKVFDPKTKQPIIEWIGDREEIYRGKYIENFPNIIFKLHQDYGINRSLFTRGIVSINPFHTNLSGGHRKEGIFIVSDDLPFLKGSNVINIEDIHSTLLKIFFNE
jgi:predicted AlkP superfamily phosphohydrolase/phosphomutase